MTTGGACITRGMVNHENSEDKNMSQPPPISFCGECGLPMVRSPGGYATCPNMHGRLRQEPVSKSVWVERLVRAKVDMRQIPTARVIETVGPRGGKKRAIVIGEDEYRRDAYRKVPLKDSVIAILDGKLQCLYKKL